MSQWSEVLQEVVDYMNTLTLTQSFTAVSSYKPREVLADMGSTVTVIAFPNDMVRERIDRANIRKDHGVNIVVTRKIDGDDLDLDAMVDFCEELATALDEYNYPNFTTLSTASIDPVYDVPHFQETSVFQSIVKVQVAAY